MLFTGTTENVHVRKTGTGQKRQHSHNSPWFCSRHGEAGGNQNQNVLGYCSSSERGLPQQGSVSVLQIHSEVQRGAKRGSVRVAGTNSNSQLLPSQLCLAAAPVGGLCHVIAPLVTTAISLTPNCPTAAGQDGLHEFYGPDMGKLQRDHGPNIELRLGFLGLYPVSSATS